MIDIIMTVLQTPIGRLQQLSMLLQLAPMAPDALLPVTSRPVRPVANSDLLVGRLVIPWYPASHLFQESVGNATANIRPARKHILATLAGNVITIIPTVPLIVIHAVTQTPRKTITLAESMTDLLDVIGPAVEST